MHTESDIEAALLDHDGSCRDVNFGTVTWEGVRDLMHALTADFRDITVGCTSHDTDEVSIANVRAAMDLVERLGGHAQFLLNNGRGFVSHLQVFVSAPSGTQHPDVELTFFPPDVRATGVLANSFLAWAERLRTVVHATIYYARYENASWEFGDTGPTSGVFFVRTT